jgi:hypothetical protein
MTKSFIRLLIIGIMLNFSTLSKCYSMHEDESNSKYTNASLKAPIVALDIDEKGDEGTLQREIRPPSRVELCKNYLWGSLLENGTTAAATLVGGAIGFGILSSHIDIDNAAFIMRESLPVIIGSVAGYAGGSIVGKTIRKICVRNLPNHN